LSQYTEYFKVSKTEFRFPTGSYMFLSAIASRQAPSLIHLPTDWVNDKSSVFLCSCHESIYRSRGVVPISFQTRHYIYKKPKIQEVGFCADYIHLLSNKWGDTGEYSNPPCRRKLNWRRLEWLHMV